MEHVAIDLGGRESQVCVRREDGAILEERRCRTKDLGTYLSKRPSSRVILETCAEAFRVADQAQAAGHQVRVVAATLVRSLGVGARRTKTDRRDAQVLSEVSTRIELQGVHVPSTDAREWRSVCSTREALVSSRTQLVNATRGWLRTQLIRIRSGAVETFVKRVRQALGKPPAQIAWLLASIETLDAQIAQANKHLEQLAEADARCQLLMTMPGVGALTAVQFAAALDEVSRFAGAHQLQAYLGLTPGEDSSSERVRRTSITKCGNTSVRRTLVQAALSAKRCRRNEPMVQWALGIEQRRGKHVATVALARKMAGILFAMWRDGTAYTPSRAAAPMPT
jgi:transposase